VSVRQLLDLEIRYETLVRAEPKRVWEAIATAEGLNQWFTSGAEWELQPGAPMTWRWEKWGVDEVTAEGAGKIIEADAPHRFVFTWENGSGPQQSTVTILLSPHPDGTRVDLTDVGYPDTPEGRRALMNCAGGWGEALTLLKFFVEHGLRYQSGGVPGHSTGCAAKSTPISTVGT
jgi:uncharacterized protein YndB with AHSA1/START domain